MGGSGPAPKSIAEHAANIAKLMPQFQMGQMGQNFQNAMGNSFLPSQSLYDLANRYANPVGMQSAPMRFAQPYQMVQSRPPEVDYAGMAKQGKNANLEAAKRAFVMSRLGRF